MAPFLLIGDLLLVLAGEKKANQNLDEEEVTLL